MKLPGWMKSVQCKDGTHKVQVRTWHPGFWLSMVRAFIEYLRAERSAVHVPNGVEPANVTVPVIQPVKITIAVGADPAQVARDIGRLNAAYREG